MTAATRARPGRSMRPVAWWLLGCALLAAAFSYRSSSAPPPQDDRQTADQRVGESINHGVQMLLQSQEGDEKAEWPYEGVYRVQGEIPIGYRVGGTSICAIALISVAGYLDDPARQE